MYRKYFKNLTDFFVSIILILLLMPFFIILYIFLFILNGGSVFFVQKRFGLNNKFFYIYKLRTLDMNTKNIPTNKIIDYKYLKLGKFLRKTNIDELPQLFNVIKGDMALIGPRPALYNQIYLKNLRTRHFIHQLKPGITGFAQVNGYKNMNERNKLKLDLYYLNNLSFFLDIKIFFSTLKYFFIEAPKH